MSISHKEGEESMGESFRIREARVEDYHQLTELTKQLGYTISPNVLCDQLKEVLVHDEHRVFVAELVDGNVVGWVHSYIYRLFYANLMIEIGGLVVEENYRNLGIGRKLMEQVEKWAKQWGCSTVSLRSNVIRKEAHVFYETIGYRRVKEQITFRKEL